MLFSVQVEKVDFTFNFRLINNLYIFCFVMFCFVCSVLHCCETNCSQSSNSNVNQLVVHNLKSVVHNLKSVSSS